MEFRYVPPEYSRTTGVVREWEDASRVIARVAGGEVTIIGNRAGLLSLAKHLITLCQPDVPARGCHFHYWSGDDLEDDSADLIIARLDD